MKPVFCRSHMRLLVFTSVPCLLSSAAFATNGMLMEGYGPESTGMGGVATAIHNGNAGMANNPATLTQMADGESRLDVLRHAPATADRDRHPGVIVGQLARQFVDRPR